MHLRQRDELLELKPKKRMQAGNKVRMCKLITGCKKFRKRKLGFPYHAICRYITILTNK